MRQIIVVYQLGVSKHFGPLAKKPFHHIAVLFYLLGKFMPRVEKAQTVIVGLSQKFNTAGLSKGMKGTQNFRAELLELLQQRTGDTVSNFESTLVFAYQLKH
jgi:hypothetical protein